MDFLALLHPQEVADAGRLRVEVLDKPAPSYSRKGFQKDLLGDLGDIACHLNTSVRTEMDGRSNTVISAYSSFFGATKLSDVFGRRFRGGLAHRHVLVTARTFKEFEGSYMACRIASDAFRSLVPLAAPHARLFKARQAKTWTAMAFKVHFGVADTWYKTSAILHGSRGFGSFMPTPLQQRVVRLATRRRLIRAKDLDAIEVPRTYLARMTKAGMLERRGRGLYALAGKDVSEQETLLEAVMLVPHGVVCLLSALRFHGLTTQNPHEVWLAIGRDQWRPTRKYPPVRIVRMSGATMTSGVEKRRIDGIEVRVFSPAKTVVDCFRYRNKVGLDVALEALREAWRRKAVSMAELTTEARKLRMERVMRPYLESLV